MRPADSALGIFRNPDPDLCVPGRRVLRPRVRIVKKRHQEEYTASLELDTFPEIFRSAIIGNYDCEKGLLAISTRLCLS